MSKDSREPKARRNRALIIGGSIGGLFAAHFLRRAGWDAGIFERSAGDLADRGAGLGITAELFHMMRRAGLKISRSLAFHVHSSIWLTQTGEIGCETARGWDGSAWAIIYKPLRAAFPSAAYRTGMTLERVEQDDRGVTAIFTDGRREHGDLLIAADGVYSTIRRQFLPGIEPRAAGYIAWRGLVDEKNLPEGAYDLLFDRSAFTLPEGELVVSLPVPGPENDMRPGRRRYYFIWYRPADAARRAALFTDASGRSHGLTIPPPLIRPDFIAEMKAAAKKGLPPILGEIVARAPQPLLQSITDMEAPQIVFGRVALLGDSAFLARPHVAAGATKAALDAGALADALEGADDIAAGLARYERERLAFGRAIVAHSRHLGAYLEAQLRPPAERSAAETTRDPLTLIAEYGAPHLVHGVDPASLDD